MVTIYGADVFFGARSREMSRSPGGEPWEIVGKNTPAASQRAVYRPEMVSAGLNGERLCQTVGRKSNLEARCVRSSPVKPSSLLSFRSCSV